MGRSTRKHSKRHIDCHLGLEMTHEQTVEYAASIMRHLSQDPFRVRKRKRDRYKQRFIVHSSSQRGTLELLTAVCPYMITKHAEAALAVDYLRRATHEAIYIPNDVDSRILEYVRRLKKGDPQAQEDSDALIGCVSAHPVFHTTREQQLAWLAGLFDGEGCISMGCTRKSSPGFIDCKVSLEMAHAETVEYAASIMRLVSRDPIRVHLRKPRGNSKQHYTASASSKGGTLDLLTAIIENMVTKRAEAGLAIDYLRRAVEEPHYKSSSLDRAIAECARRLKKSDPTAEADALRILGSADS